MNELNLKIITLTKAEVKSNFIEKSDLTKMKSKIQETG